MKKSDSKSSSSSSSSNSFEEDFEFEETLENLFSSDFSKTDAEIYNILNNGYVFSNFESESFEHEPNGTYNHDCSHNVAEEKGNIISEKQIPDRPNEENSSTNDTDLKFKLVPHNTRIDRLLVSSKDLLLEPRIFQNLKEPRIQFLLRFPYIWQELLNSGNLLRLKSLWEDVMTDDCQMHLFTSPPFKGLDKFYEMACNLLRLSPDYYMICSNIRRLKKRVIAFYCRSYGTLPSVREPENSVNEFNFGGSSLESLDEFHRAQKVKYDMLRSGNKQMRFERKSFVYLMLNRECNKIAKMVTKASKVEIFEK